MLQVTLPTLLAIALSTVHKVFPVHCRVTSCTRCYNSFSMRCTPAAATASNSSAVADSPHKTSRAQGHFGGLVSKCLNYAITIRQSCQSLLV